MVNLSKFNLALMLLIAALAGMLLYKGIGLVSAHGGDTSLIHACVKTSNGSVRIVGVNDSCTGGETALDWTQTASTGPALGEFLSNDLTNMSWQNYSFNFRNFDGANFSGGNVQSTSSYNAMINASFVGADFSNLSPSTMITSGSNFTDATFENSDLTLNTGVTNFTNANFTNVIFRFVDGDTDLTGANFTGANFTNAVMTGVDFSVTTLTGVIWNNTTCPDGTNSDSHSNTCVGHLIP